MESLLESYDEVDMDDKLCYISLEKDEYIEGWIGY